jgi:hypothetical protein
VHLGHETIPSDALLGREYRAHFLLYRVGDGAQSRQHLIHYCVGARPAVLHDNGDTLLLFLRKLELLEHTRQPAIGKPRHGAAGRLLQGTGTARGPYPLSGEANEYAGDERQEQKC